MPTNRLARHLSSVFSVATTVILAGTASAQVAAPVEVSPTVVLRYRELTNRDQFPFVTMNQKYTKSVGDLTMEFPAGVIPSAGLDPAVRTFCVEPLVPMYAGEVYPFAVDPLGKPAAFGLPDTPEGVAAGEKRARFVRELYGRFYSDIAADPKVNAPAFQVALWELSQETEVPDGPMPFSLFTGTFRADYPAEADAPEFVRQGQKYVQTLTGDDSVFAANPALAGLELTRLTALQPVGGTVAGQSQLALRTALIDDPGSGGAGLGGPAYGSLGGIPTGFGGSPLRGGGGLGGPAGGSGGGFGGGGGGIGGGGVGTTVPTTPSTDTTPPRGGPVTTTPGLIPTIPSAPGTDTGTSNGGPSTQLPQLPPGITTPLTPVAPVPAPAGVVLAAVGLAMLGGRRLLGRAG